MMHTAYTNDTFSKGLRKAALAGQRDAQEIAKAFASGPKTDLVDTILFVLDSCTYAREV